MLKPTTTIAAQATPPGIGGVGIIRISGSAVPKIAVDLLGKIPKPRFSSLAVFKDKNGHVIDNGLAIYFAAPHSFTGEDILELHGHGGRVVLDSLLARVLELGAVLAKTGEFSERAFLNGKIDLVEAEAIADLINATSKQSAHSAVRSLQGEFSNFIEKLKEKIINLRVRVEALIDFPEDEVGFEQSKHLEFTLRDIFDLLFKVEQGATQGTLLRDGIKVVIVGKPNVGKSSLLNCLSGDDRAIVTPIPGTTRDILCADIQIDGLPVHVVDTAGLRETNDIVEREGVRRAYREIETADHVLCMIDAAANKTRNSHLALHELGLSPQQNNITVVYNKIDLTGDHAWIGSVNGIETIYLSLRNYFGVDLLREHLKSSVGYNASLADTSVFSARRRHLDALRRVKEQLLIVREYFFNKKGAIELVAHNLHEAQKNLGEITGEFSSEDLLNQIFSEFCIGK